MLTKFYLNKNISFNKILIKKIFSKYIYAKLLIINIYNNLKYKSIFDLDNYFIEFSIKLKKKSKRLNFFFSLKTGKFLKCNIFMYTHSKLKFIYFLGTQFNTYIKKKIYFSLNNLKNTLKQLNIIFIYKNVRGGFLGFSNTILGFFSKKYFKKLKIYLKQKTNLLIYKNYFILLHILSCVPYKYTNFSSFFFF